MKVEAPQDFDWTLGHTCGGNPVDLERLLWPSTAGMDLRRFKQTDTRGWPIDEERQRTLSCLINEIRSWGHAPLTSGSAATALRRFVVWVDTSDAQLSRQTIVDLLAEYNADAHQRLALLKRAASALSLTETEHARLFPKKEVAPENIACDWLRSWPCSGGRTSADFARLLQAGDASLRTYEWNRNRQSRLAQTESQPDDRGKFIIELRREFFSRLAEASLSNESAKCYWGQLRKWVVWCDANGIELTAETSLDALQRYSAELTTQWRSQLISRGTPGQLVLGPLYLVSAVVGKQVYEVKPTLHLPPRKYSGRTTKYPGGLVSQRFCANLSTIIEALSVERLLSSVAEPLEVTLWGVDRTQVKCVLPQPYGGYGSGIAPSAANIPLINLRIWAELHRYLIVTGVNRSVAERTTVADHATAAPVWKARAKRFISARFGKLYGHRLERHQSFLDACTPTDSDECLMFPSVVTNGNSPNSIAALSRSGQLALRLLPMTGHPSARAAGWLRSAGCESVGARGARAAKASWLMRRYSGDSFQVSRDLGNTPQVAMLHYGGKGNMEYAALEWSNLWEEESEKAALASGGCGAPGKYQPTSASSTAGPCNETGCFGCINYRAEDSIDYVHRILSYQRILTFRVGSNPSVERTICLIDQIISDYLKKHPDLASTVSQLRENIDDNPHPQFEALLRLLQSKC